MALCADGDYMCYTRHEPVGICGQIIPVSDWEAQTVIENRKGEGGEYLCTHALTHVHFALACQLML